MQKNLFFKWQFTTSVLKQYVLQTLFHPPYVPEVLLTAHIITFAETTHCCDRMNFRFRCWFMYFKALAFLLSISVGNSGSPSQEKEGQRNCHPN